MAEGNFSGDELAKYVERVERLVEERASLDADIREVKAEAKDAGFDVKILNKVVQRRKRARKDVEEEDDLIRLYEDAVDRALKDLIE